MPKAKHVISAECRRQRGERAVPARLNSHVTRARAYTPPCEYVVVITNHDERADVYLPWKRNISCCWRMFDAQRSSCEHRRSRSRAAGRRREVERLTLAGLSTLVFLEIRPVSFSFVTVYIFLVRVTFVISRDRTHALPYFAISVRIRYLRVIRIRPGRGRIRRGPWTCASALRSRLGLALGAGSGLRRPGAERSPPAGHAAIRHAALFRFDFRLFTVSAA
jgi:hypothetical protein